MDNLQITKIVKNLSETQSLFQGCYKNDDIPFSLLSRRHCFFIVNTSINVNSMGHWLLFYIKDFNLYFFDSFGLAPFNYGGDVHSFFNKYNNFKTMVFNSPIQSDSSYVCGAYVIYFAYMMSRNYSYLILKKKFTKNKRKNDSIVSNFIYKITRTQIKCNSSFCPSYMFLTSCRKYCSCK